VSHNIYFPTHKSRLVKISSINLICYNFYVTKLLQQAIARLRELPDDMQDSAARVLISQLEEDPEPGDLEAIKEGREDFARGAFVTLDEWRHEMGLGDR
jgi:hypothetical protein